MSGEGFHADPRSINGNAHLLVEIAGLLRQGRPDQDTGTLTRVPHTHPEVAAEAGRFAAFAGDQYGDLVVLLTALSTALRTTAGHYTEVDRRTEEDFWAFLEQSSLRPARAAGR
ncbi:hypothetical protein [Kitasatospora camelliae]|uniref:Uncharacterized protein n=1 Tax=Kitasatospora camelliae TaxID=3156397 RepID=A0AAU8K516_9ACTN